MVVIVKIPTGHGSHGNDKVHVSYGNDINGIWTVSTSMIYGSYGNAFDGP